jgi:hypothetical protein
MKVQFGIPHALTNDPAHERKTAAALLAARNIGNRRVRCRYHNEFRFTISANPIAGNK